MTCCGDLWSSIATTDQPLIEIIEVLPKRNMSLLPFIRVLCCSPGSQPAETFGGGKVIVTYCCTYQIKTSWGGQLPGWPAAACTACTIYPEIKLTSSTLELFSAQVLFCVMADHNFKSHGRGSCGSWRVASNNGDGKQKLKVSIRSRDYHEKWADQYSSSSCKLKTSRFAWYAAKQFQTSKNVT